MKTKKHRTKPIAIDLFAGAGALSYAAQQCNVEVRVAIELDENASTTYKRNLVKRGSDWPQVLRQDIRAVKWDQVLETANLKTGECDLLLGGPPCQGFSTHRLNGSGVGDPRNDLLLCFMDAVASIKPRAFIIENVPGILWPRHSDHLERCLNVARNHNYKIFGPSVLNARDFGVPQNRKRVFIVGFELPPSVGFQWPPAQTHFDPDSEDVVHYRKKPWATAASVFRKRLLAADENNLHMKHGSALLRVFRSTPANGGSRSESCRVLPCHEDHDGHKDVYGRIDPRRPGPTMTTACINPSKGRFLHPVANHGITVRHAARFQSFPDDFVFLGGLIASGVQIGNAVPPTLGKKLIRNVLRGLSR
jgi:DNA (cytosine-5)-methyltransferase 1